MLASDHLRAAVSCGFVLLAAAAPSLATEAAAKSGGDFGALAAAAEQVGDLAAAADLLRSAVELEPQDPEHHAALGRVLALTQKYPSAVAELRLAVELGRGDLETLFYLGSSLWENGEIAAAREVFEEALARFGRHPVVLAQFGRLLLWSGRHAEAIRVLDEMLSLDPGDPAAQMDLARALDGAGERERALEAYRRAVVLAPEHAEIRYVLARLLRQAGEFDQAEVEFATYRELYRAEQERTRALSLERSVLDQGRDLLRRGEASAAIALLASQAETADTLSLLARAHAAANDLQAAVAVLERALAKSPQREDLRAQLRALRLRSSGR